MKTGTKIATPLAADKDPVAAVEDVDMSKVVCFKHKEYAGESTPNVECKVCCKIYVDRLTVINKEKLQNLAFNKAKKEKQKEVLEKRIKRRANQFDSSWI